MKTNRYSLSMKTNLIQIFSSLFALFLSMQAAHAAIEASLQDEVMESMESNSSVDVDTIEVRDWKFNGGYISFLPKNKTASIGFIFYPGANVQAEAYAPVLKQIAEQGISVFAVRQPFKMAVFGYDRAQFIIEKYSHQIKLWSVGGHSLGGIGATFAGKSFQDEFAGIVLWASYPTLFSRIDQTNLRALSISAELDGLTRQRELEAFKKYLPKNSYFYEIKGGNHTQFGSYKEKPQFGDNKASITRSQQQSITARETANFLKSLAAP